VTAAASITTSYLVEWYRPDLTRQLIDQMVTELNEAAANMRAEDSAVWLVMTVAVPSDEVLYGVFAAESPEMVQKTCARAGLVPERMSVDVDARITQHV
jgi:hypothetical protein